MIKKLAFYALVLFYIFAGINHFINPEFYIPLIPPIFSSPELINYIAGIAEIVLALGLLVEKTRKLSAYGIMLMLLAFVPSHTYFIQIGGCIEGGLCAPMWLAWFRLVLVHPILLAWAFLYRNYTLHPILNNSES